MKVQANVFDLNYNLKHISLRDQIIRARMLVRDLVEGQQLEKDDQVLIIGAGAAGIAAAMQLEAHGVKTVVVDKANEPFSLFSAVTQRYLGPYMYEWPSVFYDDQRFPPKKSPLKHWVKNTSQANLEFTLPNPETAAAIAKEWKNQLISWIKNPIRNAKLVMEINPGNMRNEVLNWHNEISKNPQATPPLIRITTGNEWPTCGQSAFIYLRPNLIFLAGGFGEEKTQIPDLPGNPMIKGKSFWSNDNLTNSFAGSGCINPPVIAVFGGGDGALQDVLRALTRHETPLGIVEEINKNPSLKSELEASMSRLAAIEHQHETVMVWEAARIINNQKKDTAHQSLHAACQAEAKMLIKNRLLQTFLRNQLRADIKEVHLVVKKNFFSKTYALNRFFVLLYNEFYNSLTTYTLIPVFKIHYGETLKYANKKSSFRYDLILSSGITITNAYKPIVRIGIDISKTVGQQLGLTNQDTVNRRELAEIKLPFWLSS